MSSATTSQPPAPASAPAPTTNRSDSGVGTF